MKNKKKYLLAVPLLAGLVGLGAFSVNAASNDTNWHDTLVQKIAQKFNTSEDQVEAVFDEYRNERQTVRKQEREEKLNEAEAAGVITAEQKSYLMQEQEERQAEMRAKRQAGERPSAEDREKMREERQAHRDEMEKWAEENGVDLTKLREYMPFGNGEGRGGGGPHGFGADEE